MKELYIQGIFNEFAGRRDQLLADLEGCLEHRDGPDSDENVSDSIKRNLEEIAKYENLLGTMHKYFQAQKQSTPGEPTT